MQHLTQLMFDTYHVPAMFVCPSGILSTYASGFTYSVIVEIGESATRIFPIYDGYAVHKNTLLERQGITIGDHEVIREIKEKLCYIAQDFDRELEESKDSLRKDYTLPDGHKIMLGTELFCCTEILFRPSVIGSELLSVPQLVYQSICKSDIDLRRDMIRNIVLSGKTTKISGFLDRFQAEMKKIIPANTKLVVRYDPANNFSPWDGGSIMTSLRSFQDMWIVSDEYKESGPSIIQKKLVQLTT